MRKLHLIAGVAAALLLGACGGDETGPGGDGGGGGGGTGSTSFSATLTGGITGSLSGTAYYGDDEQTTGGGFGLSLGGLDAGAQGTIAVVRAQGGRPATGTYTLFDLTGGESAAESDFVMRASLKKGSEYQVCTSRGGTFRVTSSAGERIKGTFEADLACLPMLDQINGDVTEVSVSGSFDAVKAVVPAGGD